MFDHYRGAISYVNNNRVHVMHDVFAKMFSSEKYGQIVAIRQGADETGKPEIRFFFQPPAMGVCSLAMVFDDTDDGWDAQEEAFAKLKLDAAEKTVGVVIDNISSGDA